MYDPHGVNERGRHDEFDDSVNVSRLFKCPSRESLATLLLIHAPCDVIDRLYTIELVVVALSSPEAAISTTSHTTPTPIISPVPSTSITSIISPSTAVIAISSVPDPPKQGCGRPRKTRVAEEKPCSDSAPTKRGRGRPPMAVASDTDESNVSTPPTLLHCVTSR